MFEVDLGHSPASEPQTVKLPIYLASESERKPNAQPEEYLDVGEIDPIFSSSYEMQIKESFRDDKNFIIAKIKTRTLTSQATSHSHFFNAYGILRVIFKKRREEIVGRFHHQYPMAAKNPLTNNVGN